MECNVLFTSTIKRRMWRGGRRARLRYLRSLPHMRHTGKKQGGSAETTKEYVTGF